MKTTLWIFKGLALLAIAFNLYHVDWSAPLTAENTVAWIGVMASASAFVLVWILRVSKKIEEHSKS